MVAIYHIWIQRVSGGVDVFFVVAAFFIVGSFLRNGAPSLGDLLAYYSKTLRRVVPSAALVILATIVVSLFLMPDSMWRNQIKHALASTLFLENWALAMTATNYLSQGSPPSPFQQLWALAVQVQFYFVFPLLIWMAGLIDRRLGSRRRQACIYMLVTITTVSFLYSLYITAKDQPWAYFDTFARAWEFAIGGLLAFVVTRITLPRYLARVLGWLSLIVLLTFALVVNVSTLFPGAVALVPVLAACGIVISARNRCDMRLLNNRYVVWFGDMSFSFYLWHWPLLSFYRYTTGSFDIGLLPGVGIILSAGILAYLTTWGFETPLRRSVLLSRQRLYSVAACALLLVVPTVAASAWYHDYQGRRTEALTSLAAYLEKGVAVKGEIYPPTLIASMDLPVSSKDGCHQSPTGEELVECTYGDENADTTVVLAGGSHAQQWLGALREVARQENLRLITLTKGACMLSLDADADYMEYPSCHVWNEKVIDRIREIQPDLVFTNATRGQGNQEKVPKGYLASWKALAEGGVDVLALRDNPWFGFDVPECIDLHRDSDTACAKPRDTLLAERPPTNDYDLDNVYFGDVSDLFCDDNLCHPRQDGVLIYRDGHHITNTFSLLQAPRIREIVDQALTAFTNHGPRISSRDMQKSG